MPEQSPFMDALAAAVKTLQDKEATAQLTKAIGDLTEVLRAQPYVPYVPVYPQPWPNLWPEPWRITWPEPWRITWTGTSTSTTG